MKTPIDPRQVGWPSLALNLAFVLTLLAPGPAHAQNGAPVKIQRWQCEADCFVIQSDGFTLAYAGYYPSGTFKKRSDAFKDIGRYGCGPGNLLLKRVFKGIETRESTVDVTDRERRSHWRFQSLSTSTRVRHYRLTSSDARAVFDVSEATEDNSCHPVDLDQETIDVLPNGDRALG